MARKAFVYIHGKGGTASASEYFKPFFSDCDSREKKSEDLIKLTGV